MKSSGSKEKRPDDDVAPPPRPISQKVSVGTVVALLVWLMVVCGATLFMTRYSNIPGDQGPIPVAWPLESKIPFSSDQPTLVMFAHPHCPCTRASLGELEQFLAQVPGPLSAHVIFLKPAGTGADWEKTDLWRKASSIRGVTVYTDNAGVEAHRFHAETSGQTLLFDPAGNLRFHGGITFSRGHAGDNPGRSALQKMLREGYSNEVGTPVFGCALFQTECQKGDIVCKP